MIPLIRKEISSFLSSLIGYVAITIFLTAMGLFLWVFPESSVLDYGLAELGTLFNTAPYIFLFLIPAITMRSFAEEIKGGTLELLLTRPLSEWQIVLGKYLAAVALVMMALIPTVLYYVSVYQLGNPVGNVDSASVVGSYIGLILLGGVFAAIGLFTSCLTDSQIVAFVLAVFFSFLFYAGFGSLANINVWGTWSQLVSKLGLEYHYYALSKGLIDSRNVLYMLSVIGGMLMATRVLLENKKG